MPKVINQLWVGPWEMPDREKWFVQQMKEMNPDYEHKLWTDQNLPPLPPKVQEACERFRKREDFVYVADVLRIYLTYEFGGLYIDADYKPIKPIADLQLENYEGFIVLHSEFTTGNDIFGCAPKTGFIKHAMDVLNKVNTGDFWPCWFNSRVKEYVNIKEVHDYYSEECKIVGAQFLKALEANKIKWVFRHGQYENIYMKHFGLNAMADEHKQYFKEGNQNYQDTVYKIKW